MILERKITLDELQALAQKRFGDMIKAVVDVRKRVIALDADLHADLEEELLAAGSRSLDLWGINLYPAKMEDSFLEYDSLINIRPSSGNRSRQVEDPRLQALIREIIGEWVSRP